jgi:ABC-type lipoprotein export system ATPase subunit
MLNLAPIIFIDEGFSQVSSQYIEPLLQFIEELANMKEFIFVLVTHDTRLMYRAVQTYEVENGVVTKVERRVPDGQKAEKVSS